MTSPKPIRVHFVSRAPTPLRMRITHDACVRAVQAHHDKIVNLASVAPPPGLLDPLLQKVAAHATVLYRGVLSSCANAQLATTEASAKSKKAEEAALKAATELASQSF